jgi:hypothetical protein
MHCGALVFVHIGKTGGTTVDERLLRSTPEERRHLPGPELLGPSNASRLQLRHLQLRRLEGPSAVLPIKLGAYVQSNERCEPTR